MSDKVLPNFHEQQTFSLTALLWEEGGCLKAQYLNLDFFFFYQLQTKSI